MKTILFALALCANSSAQACSDAQVLAAGTALAGLGFRVQFDPALPYKVEKVSSVEGADYYWFYGKGWPMETPTASQPSNFAIEMGISTAHCQPIQAADQDSGRRLFP